MACCQSHAETWVKSAADVCAVHCRREVPREPLLLVIRSFGGAVAWAGQGSPLDEADESITHQVCHWTHIRKSLPNRAAEITNRLQ